MPDGARSPLRPVVDEQDVQESLDFLLETAEPAAMAIAEVERAEGRKRRVRAAQVMLSLERSQDKREAEALMSAAYERAEEDYCQSVQAARKYQHVRRLHELRIEVWRSLNANRRQEKL